MLQRIESLAARRQIRVSHSWLLAYCQVMYASIWIVVTRPWTRLLWIVTDAGRTAMEIWLHLASGRLLSLLLIAFTGTT